MATKKRTAKEVIDALGAKPDEIVRLQGDEGSRHYGDYVALSKHDTPTLDDYYMPGLLSGSDYSGTLVQQSNAKVFLKQFGRRKSVHELYGGHGTFAVVIRLGGVTDEMIETFNSISDYPIIDDDAHDKMEREAQDEAWNDWAKSDFVKELGKAVAARVETALEKLEGRFKAAGIDPGDAFDVNPVGLVEAADLAELIDVLEVFYKTSDKIGEYWITESGGDVWVNVKKIAKGVDPAVLNDLAVKVIEASDLPLDPYRVAPGQLRLPGVQEKRRCR